MTSEDAGLPVVAVVGRPNVGKSSLVNRIVGRRAAIVDASPGVTRDRTAFVAEWAGRRFEIVDTGGLERARDGLQALVSEQAEVAIAAADVILFVVDAAAGLTEDDWVVAGILRRSGKPVVVAANKVDDERDEPGAAELHRLGLGPPAPVSALHGRGSGDLLDVVVATLPERGGGHSEGHWAGVAIVGRPNVGKSSILNALVRDHRSLVDSTPGTTRDPVDSLLELDDGRVLRLVDTAGIRREVKVTDSLEYYSLLRARRALERADTALLVIDASEGVTGHDQRLARDVLDAGRACVVALNKWDLVSAEGADRDRLERDLTTALRFLPWTAPLRTSAVTRRGLGRIPAALIEATEAHRRRLPTSIVNDIIARAQEHRPHPRTRSRTPRVLYAVQASVGPPTIVAFATGRLERSYVRYLENRLRVEEPWRGTPIRIEVRVKNNR